MTLYRKGRFVACDSIMPVILGTGLAVLIFPAPDIDSSSILFRTKL
jgi:hypothetical protein